MVKSVQTAHCICLVDKKGQHTYISFPGATYNLPKESIDPDFVASSKSLYISGYSLTKQPILDTTLKAINIASKNSLKIYFDPSPRIAQIPTNILKKVINHTNGLFLNEKENSILTKRLPNYQNLLEQLDFLALKQGKNGCTIYSEGKQHHYDGHKVNVIDTTGAGDVFNAAYVYGQIKRWKSQDCATFANRLAAEKVKKLGAGLNVPTRQHAMKLLRLKLL